MKGARIRAKGSVAMRNPPPKTVRVAQRRVNIRARAAIEAPAALASVRRPSEADAPEFLRATLLFSSLTELDLANLAASCHLRDVPSGELLITQGEPGDDLFVVVSGRLRVSHTSVGADEILLGNVTAGEFVGETALLERIPRTANVRAVVASQVLVLSRTTVERFLERYPDARDVLLGALRYRAEWSAARRYRPEPAVVMRTLANLVGCLEDKSALRRLEGQIQWATVPRGTLILKQGAPGDCLYFVVSGRLRAYALRDDGSEARIGEIEPGESVGEMALLSKEPRSANVAAVTDCQLLRLSKLGFDRLVTEHPKTMAAFTRNIIERLGQRIRARGLVTQLRTSPLVTVEDCVEVTRTENLVLRNLKITQMYHRLSLEMTTLIGHQDANWCTFACNASKTAGYSIRREELPFYRVFTRLGRYDALRRAWDTFGALAKPLGLESSVGRILQAVSDSISAGNLKVYAELAPIFAQVVRTFHEDVEHDAGKVESFLQAKLRPGPTEAGGQDLLREAFTHYYEAMFEPSPKHKAEIILLANLKVGLHEQIRLQPNIVEALNAPLTVGLRGALRLRVADPLSRFMPAGVAALTARGLDAAEGLALDRLVVTLRRLVTASMMQIRLPYGNLRLGADMPLLPGQRLFPDMLQTVAHPELIRFLKRFEVNPHSVKGSHAKDWGNLDDRMRFILTLFRTRQKSLELFGEPFLFEQRLAMTADMVPEGWL
jgi:CRP-like cAMP-binding protein